MIEVAELLFLNYNVSKYEGMIEIQPTASKKEMINKKILNNLNTNAKAETTPIKANTLNEKQQILKPRQNPQQNANQEEE